MQLALIILAGFGALLFILSFLGYVLSGFRHHFVTGLISMLPVLNIVTLPSLWDKNSGKFFVGLIGLIITIGAWFMGAEEGIQNLIPRDSNSVTEKVITNSAPNNTSGTNLKPSNISSLSNNTTQEKPKRSRSFNESNMLDLPNKALYRMGFEAVPVNQISTLKGRIVQILNNKNELIEGRVKNVTPSSIVLDGLFENELPIATIKELKLMVKKANQ